MAALTQLELLGLQMQLKPDFQVRGMNGTRKRTS